MKIKDKLKFIREQEGLSQSEFAKLIGVNRVSYNGWETRGKTMPAEILTTITSHPRLKKYGKFLTLDESDEAIGRFAAELEEKDLDIDNLIHELLDNADDDQLDLIDDYIEYLMKLKRQIKHSNNETSPPDPDPED